MCVCEIDRERNKKRTRERERERGEVGKEERRERIIMYLRVWFDFVYG